MTTSRSIPPPDANATAPSSAACFQALLDSLPDAAWIKDQDLRYQVVNEAFVELLGSGPLARHSVVGKTDPELLPTLADVLRSQDLRALREDREVVDEVELPGRGGGSRWLRIGRAPLRDATGTVLGTLGTARDVTAQRRRTQQLHFLPTVATLLSGVAHELNNPLNTVLNFAHLMLMDARSDDDRDALETMRREMERAAGAVADLRLIARQVDGAEEGPADVDLNESVRRAIKLCRYPKQLRRVQVTADLAGASLPVRADGVRLDEAMLLLLLHLGRTAPAQRLWVRTRAAGNEVVLEVADVEGAFRGTRGTGSPRGAGASDGPADLARVREIVAETGGSLWATTGPEDGIVATLRFPGAATRRDEPPATPLADAPRPLFILVVDDEVAIRCSIQRYLQRRGHRVDAAADGAEALALLEDLPPGTSYDVILSDLRMPGLGGRELLESIRQGRNSPAERVLFMTGDVTNNDAAWIVHATGAPALMKPIDLREVARIVERAADDPLPA